MDYGSEQVYVYSDSEEEYVSEAELEEGMWLRWVGGFVLVLSPQLFQVSMLKVASYNGYSDSDTLGSSIYLTQTEADSA